jgi:hypothetical protein
LRIGQRQFPWNLLLQSDQYGCDTDTEDHELFGADRLSPVEQPFVDRRAQVVGVVLASALLGHTPLLSARPLTQNFSSFCDEIIHPRETRWGFKGSSATVEFAVHPASPIWGLTLVNAGCSTLEVLACEEKAEGKGLWTRLAKVSELTNILALIESRKYTFPGCAGRAGLLCRVT